MQRYDEKNVKNGDNAPSEKFFNAECEIVFYFYPIKVFKSKGNPNGNDITKAL